VPKKDANIVAKCNVWHNSCTLLEYMPDLETTWEHWKRDMDTMCTRTAHLEWSNH